MFLLACDNAMQGALRVDAFAWVPSLRLQSVGDLAPAGLVVATIVLHRVRHRALSTADRTLVLVLGLLVGAFAGGISGLAFRVSALGVSTLPLLGFAFLWLEIQARLSKPHRLPERVWPIDLDHASPSRASFRHGPRPLRFGQYVQPGVPRRSMKPDPRSAAPERLAVTFWKP